MTITSATDNPPTDNTPPVDPPAPPEVPTDRSANFNQLFQDGCQAMYDNYVTPYTKVAGAYAAMVKDLNDLLTVISNATTPDSDSKYLNVNAQAIEFQIAPLMTKYNQMNIDNPIFVSQSTGEAGKAEAQRWADELQLPASCIIPVINKDDPDNPKYSLIMDLSPLQTIANAVKGGKMSTLEYQGMDAAISGERATIEGKAQLCTTGLGDANSKFESMVKSAMEVLQAQADFLKGAFQFL